MSAHRRRPAFSPGEELAHSLTHGVGLLLAIASLVLLVVFAALRGGAAHVVAVSIYGATLILLYAASTLYHALPTGRAKRVFELLDHAAIFLLIAGTYTPFTLVSLRGGWGWSLFGIVWGLAIVGAVLELATAGRSHRLSLVLYLVLGWLIVIAIRPLAATLDTGGLVLLIAGGVAYSLGVIFYLWHRLPYHHALWHLFVLGGSVAHFFAVFLYVIPSEG